MHQQPQNNKEKIVYMVWVEKLFEAQKRSIMFSKSYNDVERSKALFELEKLKDRIEFASQNIPTRP
jgi:hypothetical protein